MGRDHRGLDRGGHVVTSADFLIDSESQLKAAVGGMAGMRHWAEHEDGRKYHRVLREKLLHRVPAGVRPGLGGFWSMTSTPIDALPDLSDTPMIVYTKWPGRSPHLVKDQATFPIVTAVIPAPNITVVRGFSDFGYSYVYVPFKDGTDIYWARSRVLEYMSQLAGRLPDG